MHTNKYETLLLHAAAAKDERTGALSIPIYNASTYQQKNLEVPQEYDYSRSGNPTRAELEKLIALMEKGFAGYAFSSGMAAIASVITAVLSAGDHIIATKDIYGGTYRLLTAFMNRFGVEHSFVDTSSIDEINSALKKNTKAIFIETPSNPLLKITDIKAIAKFAKEHNLISIADNTFMTPYLLRPIEFGIDISVHSATKFLGGHSDLIAGLAIVAEEKLAKKIYFVQNTFGAVLSPQDSWLLIRGMKTVSARLKIQQDSAAKIANTLKNYSFVKKVYYPGFTDHPGHNLIKEQADGFGAILSFETKDLETAKKIMSNVKLWSVAVSLGGVEAILSYPVKMSHATIPENERLSLGITNNLIRLSPGLEDPDDLINDIIQSTQK